MLGVILAGAALVFLAQFALIMTKVAAFGSMASTSWALTLTPLFCASGLRTRLF